MSSGGTICLCRPWHVMTRRHVMSSSWHDMTCWPSFPGVNVMSFCRTDDMSRRHVCKQTIWDMYIISSLLQCIILCKLQCCATIMVNFNTHQWLALKVEGVVYAIGIVVWTSQDKLMRLVCLDYHLIKIDMQSMQLTVVNATDSSQCYWQYYCILLPVNNY